MFRNYCCVSVLICILAPFGAAAQTIRAIPEECTVPALSDTLAAGETAGRFGTKPDMTLIKTLEMRVTGAGNCYELGWKLGQAAKQAATAEKLRMQEEEGALDQVSRGLAKALGGS